MPLKTKRWDDPKDPDDGYRLLICRYRPRALPKKKETWHNWLCCLGPSRKLHADFYGKNGPPIGWEEYRRRYLEEMQAQIPQDFIEELAAMITEGKTITLLCSSACTDESRCHRSLMRQLIEERGATLVATPGAEG
jgi:uncharacterized protein YeaO (DUF488 family)